MNYGDLVKIHVIVREAFNHSQIGDSYCYTCLNEVLSCGAINYGNINPLQSFRGQTKVLNRCFFHNRIKYKQNVLHHVYMCHTYMYKIIFIFKFVFCRLSKNFFTKFRVVWEIPEREILGEKSWEIPSGK